MQRKKFNVKMIMQPIKMIKNIVMASCFILTTLHGLSQVKIISTTTSVNTNCVGVDCYYEGPSILINEVMMAPNVGNGSIYGQRNTGEQNEGEWIELYNPNECQQVDISYYFLGNNSTDPQDYGGGFLIPNGTIIPPRGFCIIRGVNAPAVREDLLVKNGGMTVEIVIDNTQSVCLGGGYRLWFPDAGGWFAFYDRNGIPQDAISWANISAIAPKSSCLACTPCTPPGSPYFNGLLPNYAMIPANRKYYISDNQPARERTFRRIPDGGTWMKNQPAAATMGTCNAECIPQQETSCSGKAVVRAVGGVPPYTYLWNDGMAQTSDTAFNLCAGTYCVEVTDVIGNKDVACVTIIDNIPPVHIIYPDPVCINVEPFKFVGFKTDLRNSTIRGNGLVEDGEGNYTFYPMEAGSGLHTITCTTIINGCKHVDSLTILVGDSLNLNYISKNETCFKDCDGSIEIQLEGGTRPFTYSWSNGSKDTSLYHICAGEYDLVVLDSINCKAELMKQIIEEGIYISADFTYTPMFSVAPSEIIFTFTGENVHTYFWDFGDENSSNEVSPVHLYEGHGNYYVQLIAYSIDSICKDTASTVVVVNKSSHITIPNIFSPNGDGINDTFFPIAENIESETMYIYNRWGRLVYEWTDVGHQWDGKSKKGEPLPAGVYYYTYTAYGNDLVEHILTGMVTLVR